MLDDRCSSFEKTSLQTLISFYSVVVPVENLIQVEKDYRKPEKKLRHEPSFEYSLYMGINVEIHRNLT